MSYRFTQVSFVDGLPHISDARFPRESGEMSDKIGFDEDGYLHTDIFSSDRNFHLRYLRARDGRWLVMSGGRPSLTTRPPSTGTPRRHRVMVDGQQRLVESPNNNLNSQKPSSGNNGGSNIWPYLLGAFFLLKDQQKTFEVGKYKNEQGQET